MGFDSNLDIFGMQQSCWISNQHQKRKSGREPSNEHFWQVWFNSVQWFQRRFKCEKVKNGDDGRLAMTKAHMADGTFSDIVLSEDDGVDMYRPGCITFNNDCTKLFIIINKGRTVITQ
jgi:hypothetical protein